jgi:UDP-N-acetylmuramoylalanine--D-glutamate ligase
MDDEEPFASAGGHALIVGFGVTGQAVARALLARGFGVTAVDEHPSTAVQAAAASMAVKLVEAPSIIDLDRLVEESDFVLPSPGIPETHPLFSAAQKAAKPVLSEFDLAGAWDDRPVVAITGTDGKTTVTTMVAEMLNRSGIAAVACGNTETPLVEAIGESSTEVFVVEASSFRLGTTRRFRPAAAVWLNFAPDHLDAHESLATYEAAKAKIWRDLDADFGLAIANASDPVVLANRNADAHTVTFGGPGTAADATVVDGVMRLADGTSLVALDELPRQLPHDITNGLAAATAAMAVGADIDAVRSVLRSFAGLPHRVQLVAEADGIRWFDDSKATTPHATLAAVSGFESVILLSGGRNKGLDLSVLATAVPPIRGVIAIGEAADDVARVFDGSVEVVRVTTNMVDTVAAAQRMAKPGDVVLLSPSCASFDWFDSYSQRGDAFASAVRACVGNDSGMRS